MVKIVIILAIQIWNKIELPGTWTGISFYGGTWTGIMSRKSWYILFIDLSALDARFKKC